MTGRIRFFLDFAEVEQAYFFFLSQCKYKFFSLRLLNYTVLSVLMHKAFQEKWYIQEGRKTNSLSHHKPSSAMHTVCQIHNLSRVFHLFTLHIISHQGGWCQLLQNESFTGSLRPFIHGQEGMTAFFFFCIFKQT